MSVLQFWQRSTRYMAEVLLAAGIVLIAAAWALNLDDARYYRPELLAGKAITIDPGHGGIDGGAVSVLGDFEKEITLQIGTKLAERLRAAGANVLLTREEDADYYTQGKGGKRSDLDKRIEMAEEHQAVLFLSIHANAIKGGRWSGAQVFYHPLSSDSKLLASTVQQYLADFPPGNRRKEKADDFYLLRKNTMPSVIVEVGFLSNAQEAERLKDEAYQDKLVEAILRGMVHYLVLKAGN
jgi:N-acetylmuramoyl-L-alanine amidase